MTVTSKLFGALSDFIKMNDCVTRISEDIKVLTKEVRDIDKRLVRLETLVEIAKEKAKNSQMAITEN